MQAYNYKQSFEIALLSLKPSKFLVSMLGASSDLFSCFKKVHPTSNRLKDFLSGKETHFKNPMGKIKLQMNYKLPVGDAEMVQRT